MATTSAPALRSTGTSPFDDEERARVIRAEIRASGAALRERHPFLKHQDLIGMCILLISIAGVVGVAIAYAAGALAWWAAIPLAAIAMSLAHELEHDLIHRLYFVQHRAVENAMLAVCWFLRPYTIHPWARRPLHLLHHKVSGTVGDIEERAITNGEPWGILRFLKTIDPFWSSVFRPRDAETVKLFAPIITPKAYLPMTYVAVGIWQSFIVINLANLVTDGALVASGTPLAALHVIDFLAVVWIAPNLLRMACLHLISSNMHYYGDIEDGNVIQQTQVLRTWWLFPAQVFCFNFGSTHGIHHFVPPEPFYIRQLTAKRAHQVMRENGVRFNDFGTFTRANRYRTVS